MAPSPFPAVTVPISDPPFQCSGHGLLFNNYPRTPLSDLRAWLFPKRRNTKALSRPKAWWQAQLVLYGLGMPKKSETIATLRARLETAVQSGECDELPAELREREARLNKQFAEVVGAERYRRYAVVGSEEEAVAAFDPDTFLRNRFLSIGGSKEKQQANVCVLKALDSGDRARVHAAAERIGLFSHSTDAPRGERWLVIGKEIDAVWTELRRINALKAKEDEESASAKRRKVEQAHEACIGGMGNGASDIVGQYNIQCDNIEQQWSDGDALSLSIFREAGKLRGSFHLRIVEGVMKFKAGGASGKGVKSPKYEFKWRGSETGTGEIYPDDKEQQGYILVQSGGKIKGKFKSVSAAGDCEFSALKVSNTPLNIDAEWDDYDDDAYESARVGRWH